MLMQPHSLMELSGNAFHLLPFAQGGCLQRAGGFFLLLLLLGFNFFFLYPPPKKLPLPFLFSMLLKKKTGREFKKNPNNKLKRGLGVSIRSPPLPGSLAGAAGDGAGWLSRTGRWGVRGPSPRSAWLLGAIFPKSLPASENFQLSPRNALAEHTVLMGKQDASLGSEFGLKREKPKGEKSAGAFGHHSSPSGSLSVCLSVLPATVTPQLCPPQQLPRKLLRAYPQEHLQHLFPRETTPRLQREPRLIRKRQNNGRDPTDF